MYEWFIIHGSIGLFVISFLAATILPFSSEAALVAALKFGITKTDALIAASIGNCLACLFNYKLGKFFRSAAEKKILSSKSGRKAMQWIEKYGPYSLILSWLPVIGDPITIAAGISKVNLFLFVAIVFFLRITRYIIIIEMVF